MKACLLVLVVFGLTFSAPPIAANDCTPPMTMYSSSTTSASYTCEPEAPNPLGYGGGYQSMGAVVKFLGEIPAEMTVGAPAYGGTIVVLERPLSLVLVKTGNLGATLTLARADLRVQFAEEDQSVDIEATSEDPLVGLQYAPSQVRAPEVWRVERPVSPVLVAIVDSGIDVTHADLALNVWSNPNDIPGDGLDNDGNGYIDDTYGYDFCSGTPAVFDNNGHGTAMAGVVAAGRGNGVGIAGVAPAKVAAIKVLNVSTDTPPPHCGVTALAKGIVYATNIGADIMTLSWGLKAPSETVNLALNYALTRGVLPVKSAGNTDGGPTTSPAERPGVLTVSATNAVETVAPYSARGSYIDIAAPGTDVWSTAPGNAYLSRDGTSLAAANAAGVAALGLAHCPAWKDSPSLLSGALTATARDKAPQGRDDGYGWGIVDAAAALATCPT